MSAFVVLSFVTWVADAAVHSNPSNLWVQSGSVRPRPSLLRAEENTSGVVYHELGYQQFPSRGVSLTNAEKPNVAEAELLGGRPKQAQAKLVTQGPASEPPQVLFADVASSPTAAVPGRPSAKFADFSVQGIASLLSAWHTDYDMTVWAEADCLGKPHSITTISDGGYCTDVDLPVVGSRPIVMLPHETDKSKVVIEINNEGECEDAFTVHDDSLDIKKDGSECSPITSASYSFSYKVGPKTVETKPNGKGSNNSAVTQSGSGA
eukprot:CAMPEP_0117575784 /NCGR_PEP_ID=MMETSP0784-20121206/62417_1 /TAXON_ID=39447 /ORGANISM="" /LENGTH=263 /DNA_ID=CAMNT_0005374929 /DNA_START=21 /DNA_END=809 /DNA_ORIENTATION=-